jgi:hypothetical protein
MRAASSAAASLAGRLTMRLVLVTIPASWASAMPRLTPWLVPKSSAFTMQKRTIRVSPHPVAVPVDADVLRRAGHRSSKMM